MNDKTVTIAVALRINDAQLLLEHASLVTGESVLDLDNAICEGVCNPEVAPLDRGYEILSKNITNFNGTHLILECRVFDDALLVKEARDCYGIHFGDDTWHPMHLEDALFEVLVASNANPSPCDIGYEIIRLTPPKNPTSLSPAAMPLTDNFKIMLDNGVIAGCEAMRETLADLNQEQHDLLNAALEFAYKLGSGKI